MAGGLSLNVACWLSVMSTEQKRRLLNSETINEGGMLVSGKSAKSASRCRPSPVTALLFRELLGLEVMDSFATWRGLRSFSKVVDLFVMHTFSFK